MAYFFFDSNDASKIQPDDVVKALIMQLAVQYLPAFEIIKDYHRTTTSMYRRTFQGSSLTAQGLLESLKTMLKAFDRVFIMFDALDECTGWDELINLINKLVSWKTARLSLFATCRRDKRAEDAINELGASHVHLDNATIGLDIQIYVKEVMLGHDSFRKWPGELRVEIQNHLIDGANGM